MLEKNISLSVYLVVIGQLWLDCGSVLCWGLVVNLGRGRGPAGGGGPALPLGQRPAGGRGQDGVPAQEVTSDRHTGGWPSTPPDLGSNRRFSRLLLLLSLIIPLCRDVSRPGNTNIYTRTHGRSHRGGPEYHIHLENLSDASIWRC